MQVLKICLNLLLKFLSTLNAKIINNSCDSFFFFLNLYKRLTINRKLKKKKFTYIPNLLVKIKIIN